MFSRIAFTVFALCLFLCSCSTNTSQNAETTATVEEIQEIQTLDSLNQQIEKGTIEIEEGIQSVEAALGELDDFE